MVYIYTYIHSWIFDGKSVGKYSIPFSMDPIREWHFQIFSYPTATAADSSCESFPQVHINFTAQSRVLSSTLDTWSPQHAVVETNGFLSPPPKKKRGIGSGSPKKLSNQYLDLWICLWSSFLSSWKLNIMGLGYGNCSVWVEKCSSDRWKRTIHQKLRRHEWMVRWLVKKIWRKNRQNIARAFKTNIAWKSKRERADSWSKVGSRILSHTKTSQGKWNPTRISWQWHTTCQNA